MTTRLHHRSVLEEIRRLTTYVVENGLADDQNTSFEKQSVDQKVSVNYSSSARFSDVLRKVPYPELYAAQLSDRLFTFKMLDGALVQMSYQYSSRKLEQYRLAYLPSPDLTPFQEDPELYSTEVLYADIVDPRVVTVPIRFDYDGRSGVAASLSHPESHLTLGQYEGCRIAATAPLTPYYFVDFLLRSFYSAARVSLPELPPPYAELWPDCCTDEERAYIHIGVPSQR